MPTFLRRLEGSDLPAAACRDFFINMATAPQQMTGDFRTASPGLCGDHYNGDEWHVLTLWRPSTDRAAEESKDRSVQRVKTWMCSEWVPGREARHNWRHTWKHPEHWGREGKVARLTDGAIKTTFTESDASMLSGCGAPITRRACLIPLTEQSRSSFRPHRFNYGAFVGFESAEVRVDLSLRGCGSALFVMLSLQVQFATCTDF